MSVHHHHVFQFDKNDKPIYFDGVLVHDHDDAEHWEGDAYQRAHRPLGSYIDDNDCMDSDSGFGPPWTVLIARVRGWLRTTSRIAGTQ